MGEGVGRARALEIGALQTPLLPKDAFDVRYVDYAATDVIRANQFDPAIDPAAIVDVDIVWGERPLREAAGGPVDVIVASHVIEHVPDLIGWLHELHATLTPGGILGLAVPDKRYTFDALRKDSVIAEAVEAFLLGYRAPSLRQVFDVAANGVAVEPGQVWRGEFRPEAARPEVLSRLAAAFKLARNLQEAPRYNDAHCWVFTPASFLDLIEEFAALDLFPFKLEGFYPTEYGANEFQVRLVATPAPDKARLAAAIAEARRAVATAEGSPAPDPLAEENRRLHAALEEMRRSTSWKATAPLRALKAALGRG